MKRPLKIVVYASLAALLVAGIVYAMRPRRIAIETGAVARAPFQVTVDEEGRTRIKERYVVAAPLAGNLARVEVRAGDVVTEGAVVARLSALEPPLLDASSRQQGESRLAAARAAAAQARVGVERARAAADFAGADLERTRNLAARGAGATRDVELAETETRSRTKEVEAALFQARVADHEAEAAEAALDRMAARGRRLPDIEEIRAAAGGRVLRVLRESEGAVAQGTAILEIGDPAGMEVVADVLSRDAVGIRPGAVVSIEGWGGAPLTGRVRLIEPAAFTKVSALGIEEQRVPVLIDLTAPRAEWTALGDGFRVTASIVVYQAAAAVQVPSAALVRDGEQWGVFVVRGDRAAFRRIEVGRLGRASAEVLSGVEPTERVILHPGDDLRDGSRIREAK